MNLADITHDTGAIALDRIVAAPDGLPAWTLDPPPGNRTAAPTGMGSGGKDHENAGERLAGYNLSHPILATHYGLGDGR